MKRHIISIITGAALLSFNAAALDVTCAAGGLRAAVGTDTSVTSLSVSGELDASDFDFISSDLTSLTSLDLSKVSIVAYKGEKTLSGRAVYNADVLPAYAFFGSTLSSVILPEGITAIDEAAFGKSAITSIAIPPSVTSIGDYAFSACSSLASVDIPAGVTAVGTGAFSDCTSLASATVSAPLTSLPASMFKGDKALESVTLPSSLQSIGAEAFASCSALSSVEFPASLRSIGEKAFYMSGLSTADLAACKSLTSLGDFAFARCTALTSARLPQRGLTLSRGVFFDDTSLRNVSLPSDLSAIPSFAFKGNTSASLDSLPKSVADIGDYALMGWSGISKFSLPASLTSLGDGAMEGWTALTELNASEIPVVPALGQEVWADIPDPSRVILYVNEKPYLEFKEADQWKDFDVRMKTSSIIEIINDNDAASAVTFDFRGQTLVIASSARPITSVAVYDLTGRMRLSSQESAQVVEIALDRLPDTVFIVQARLADGTAAGIKISK